AGAIVQLWDLDKRYGPGDSKNGDRAIKFIPVGDGSFYIQFQNSSKKVLAIKGGGTNNGAQLVAMPMGGPETHWRFEKDNNSNDFYHIVSQKSGKAVDATGGSQNKGTNLQQYDKKIHKAQQWQIK
ncbi:MAG: RICIN domain-containing protein, partial [Bacteroidales bacterium]|nr:RICIN domain-containing protein [Bacteroidales bacterium]